MEDSYAFALSEGLAEPKVSDDIIERGLAGFESLICEILRGFPSESV